MNSYEFLSRSLTECLNDRRTRDASVPAEEPDRRDGRDNGQVGRGPVEATPGVLDRNIATSLGSVESLIYQPIGLLETDSELTVQVPGSPWAKTSGLIRLSVGIESARDLITGLEHGLG